MKRIGMALLFATVVVTYVGACGQAPESKEADKGDTIPVTASQCIRGHWSCQADGAAFDYTSLACEAELRARSDAKLACEGHCTTNCTDSGWQAPHSAPPAETDGALAPGPCQQNCLEAYRVCSESCVDDPGPDDGGVNDNEECLRHCLLTRLVCLSRCRTRY
ncbi:hypothetical protein JGU66_27780 [Myxococcaceae bacterium JPH2]|nr:hypothetical protein [Myxococcaceae bacterium JPH2]